jgi:hypothetical protein
MHTGSLFLVTQSLRSEFAIVSSFLYQTLCILFSNKCSFFELGIDYSKFIIRTRFVSVHIPHVLMSLVCFQFFLFRDVSIRVQMLGSSYKISTLT